MIKKIKTISNFAVFKNFDWNSSVRDKNNNISEFKKLNIIYGRNYSGKTTLSRIFRSFENKELPPKYENINFEIELNDNKNTILKQNGLANHSLDIRVYNKDFVKDNLSFLYDENSEIKSFAILGKENVEIENQIKEKEKKLGSEEKQEGLKYQKSLKYKELIAKQKDKENVEKNLNEKLKNKAKTFDIKNYDIRNIKSDIKEVQKNEKFLLLNEQEIEQKKLFLKEDSKTEIEDNKLKKINFDIESFFKKISNILEKQIKPTNSIQELLNDSILQKWVEDGIGLHKDKRDKCAFCGGTINNELWNKLGQHFTKESDDIKIEIKSISADIEKNEMKIENILAVDKDNFYSNYQKDFEAKKGMLEDEIKKYNDNLVLAQKELQEREQNIFTAKSQLNIKDNKLEINNTIDEILEIVKKNNEQTKTLETKQENIKKELRLNEVKKFIDEIVYNSEEGQIDKLSKEENKLKEEFEKLENEIKVLVADIENLKSHLKDETAGAEKINEYLIHFFGSENIKFDPITDENKKVVKFSIKRGDEVAYKLSDGECSLVAFCYFMAKLKDIESGNKELIIWIDDPISSLDDNHIFFIFSLIKSELLKYKQLFISTHNLEFLKYLKKLLKKEKEQNYFILEKINTDKSILSIMPEYLKKHTTEFNYLFEQIYKCAQNKNNDCEDNHNCFYNFGNNLRKFLECYLFFKYPNNKNTEDNLNFFCNDNDISNTLIFRLYNEFSHLAEIPDRGMKPINPSEMQKVAEYVLNKIEKKDSDQYKALLESIGKSTT